MDILNLPSLDINDYKLPTVVVDNGEQGVISLVKEDMTISGEIVIMQRTYKNIQGMIIEETRFARLIDDVCRMISFGFNPGEILKGNIVMKQRTSFFPGYTKMKLGKKLLRSIKGNLPIWGMTYYSEDQTDMDELIESSISL